VLKILHQKLKSGEGGTRLYSFVIFFGAKKWKGERTREFFENIGETTKKGLKN
jgi:hypothetical protein